MSKLSERIKKKVQGDNEDTIISKIEKVAINCFKSELVLLEGETIDLEEKIENAKEELESAIVNNGKQITDKNSYIKNIIDCQNSIIKAEDNLKIHLETIDFLNKINDSFK